MSLRTLKWVALIAPLLLIILTGCSTADKQLADAMPYEYRFESYGQQACPAVFSRATWGGLVDEQVSIIGINKAPSLIVRFGNGEERYLSPSSSDCSEGVGSIFGNCLQNLQTKNAGSNSIEECVRNRSIAEFGSAPNLIPADLPPSSNPLPTPTAVPMNYKYYWVKPDGSRQEFGSSNEAQAAAEASWEGGSVVQVTYQGNTVVSEQATGINIPTFPQLPNDYRPASPNTPYYVNITTGQVYDSQQQAHDVAIASESGSEIHVYVRGVDRGVVESVQPWSSPDVTMATGKVVKVSPSDVYLEASISLPDGSVKVERFTSDNMYGAKQFVYENPQGGSIVSVQRGVPQSTLENVGFWAPPEELKQVFGGVFDDLSVPYWVYFPADSSGKSYSFKDEVSAQAYAESYGGNCEFPGGNVVPFVRDLAQGGGISISHWKCPEGFPSDFNPSEKYYDRNGVFYPSFSAAVKSDWGGWYFAMTPSEIKSLHRGDYIEGEIAKNTWAGWWLASLFCLFPLLLVGWLFWNHWREKKLYGSKRNIQKKPAPKAKPTINVDKEILKLLRDMLKKLLQWLKVAVEVGIGFGILAFALYLTRDVQSNVGKLSYVVVGLLGVGLYITLYILISRRKMKEILREGKTKR